MPSSKGISVFILALLFWQTGIQTADGCIRFTFGGRPYEQISEDNRCMVKATPIREYKDEKGKTVIDNNHGTMETYVLGPNGEKTLNAKYDWYSPSVYLKCLPEPSGNTSVLLIRRPGSLWAISADWTRAFAFYLDGKLMNRYSTLDIALFGENVLADMSTDCTSYQFLKKVKGFERGEDGQLYFRMDTYDGRTVSFDLPSGRVTSHLKNNKTQQALFDAVGKGDIAGIKKALKQRAKINDWYKDGYARPFGWTPLRYALQKKQEAAARLLIEKGADVNAKSFDGIYNIPQEYLEPVYHSILWSLRDKGFPQWVEPSPSALNRSSSNANPLRRPGTTLLYDIVYSGSEKFTRLLLENGADINLVSGYLDRPLYMAVILHHRKPGLIKLLLQYGGDPDAKYGGRGESPREFAKLLEKEELLKLMEQYSNSPRTAPRSQPSGTGP